MFLCSWGERVERRAENATDMIQQSNLMFLNYRQICSYTNLTNILVIEPFEHSYEIKMRLLYEPHMVIMSQKYNKNNNPSDLGPWNLTKELS